MTGLRKVGMRSGDLYRSFGLNGKGTLTKIKRNDQTGIEVIVGSDLPYAKIQNDGGFIKATPVTVMYKYDKNAENKMGAKLQRPVTTYKMALYFWAKWHESNEKDDFFKWTALKVHKLGGMKVEATHYFDNAIKDFKIKYEPKMVNELITLLEKDFSNIDNSDDINKVAAKVSNTMRNYAKKIPNFFLLSLADNMTDRMSKE